MKRQTGKMPLGNAGISRIVEVNYTVWSQLAVEADLYSPEAAQQSILANYAEGNVLLTSSWDQGWPYNDQCPNLGCPGNNGHALVGCNATAAAQIMRYWCWPPSGVGGAYADSYDWPNMPDILTGGSTAAEINATAELCSEVGVAFNSNYGCNETSADHSLATQLFENNFRYSTSAVLRERSDYTAVAWFDIIKDQINQNRPIFYHVTNHNVVCDGWRETGNPVLREYHMNYGHNDTDTAWYELDEIDPGVEDMVEGLKPIYATGAVVVGTYTVPAFPYRYVDQDAECGTSATFNAGHHLQFLPNVTLTCTSTTDYLRINSTSAENTRLFTRGDLSEGALLLNSAIKMSHGGALVLR